MSWVDAVQIVKGPIASRPAANAVPPNKYGWFATDTLVLSISDGSVWTDIGPGSGGVPTSRTLTAGAALTGGGTLAADRTFDVAVDGSTIEVASDALRVKADGITANEIAAGAVGASELASTAVTPATYGDATHVPVFTVDADGRITAVTNTGITGAGTGITDPGGSNDDFLQRKAGGWTNRSVAQVKTDLGIPAAAPIGSTALVYRYTVTGSDKASIDTGVDTPDAGSNDWTNGDVLEVWFYGRTDEVTVDSAIQILLNNDTGSVYDRMTVQGVNATASAFNVRGAAAWANIDCAGASAGTNMFSSLTLTIPNYTGAVGNKTAAMHMSLPDGNAATNMRVSEWALQYRPATPAAITRLAVSITTAAKKFKVGSQLLIYKRTAS